MRRPTQSPASLSRGKLARRAQVNPETIRFYERSGLLPECPRSPSGHRRFPESAVGLLVFIKQVQGLGFSLNEVRELLTLRPPGSAPLPRPRMLQFVAAVESKLEQLQQLRDLLLQSGPPPAGE